MSDERRVLAEVVVAVGGALRREEQRLCDLDAAVGDGDHGLTMVRCWSLVEREAQRDDDASLAEVLERAGRAVVAAGGGATGPILGSALIAAGRAAGDPPAAPSSRIADMLDAAADEVARRGRVDDGDRTTLDALRPAASAARGAADAGAVPMAVVSAAAQAAEAGSRATAGMVPRAGRATRLGERALGHPDPGAVSVAIVLRAAADRLASPSAAEQGTV